MRAAVPCGRLGGRGVLTAASSPCGTASASDSSHAIHGEPEGMRRMMPYFPGVTLTASACV